MSLKKNIIRIQIVRIVSKVVDIKKINRIEHLIEGEFLWSGTNQRKRWLFNSGYWCKTGQSVVHGTLSTKGNNKKKLLIKEKEAFFLRESLSQFNDVKIVWTRKEKRVNQYKISYQCWYFQVCYEDQFYTLLLKENKNESIIRIQKKITEWSSELSDFLKLPVIEMEIEPGRLIFSQQALGCLFHEIIGHTAEGFDDLHIDKIPCLFDISDTPGKEYLMGYCPFDDLGTKGKKNKILSGRSGIFKKMNLDSGIMRSVNWLWHPIVRQRCLDIKSIKFQQQKIPNMKNSIFIESFEMGSWSPTDNSASVISSCATYTSKNGQRFRMFPFQIRASLQSISYIIPYGKRKSWNPPAGCHVDLQRGLPVSFTSPSGWIDLKKVPQKIIEFL